MVLLSVRFVLNLISSTIKITITSQEVKHSLYELLSLISYIPGGKVYPVVVNGKHFMSKKSKVRHILLPFHKPYLQDHYILVFSLPLKFHFHDYQNRLNDIFSPISIRHPPIKTPSTYISTSFWPLSPDISFSSR